MSLPEWVDRSSPDDPRAAGLAEESGEGQGTTDPVLAGKPVLEWTADDWARWVAGEPVDVGGAPEPAAEPETTATAVVGRVEEDAHADLAPADGDAGAGAGAGSQEATEGPIVDIRLPEEDGLGGDEPKWWDPPVALLAEEEPAGALTEW
ncbi:MAG: hypothetical protein ACRD0S_04765, partial [Acidimicrobiales bacterium]